MAYNPRDHYFRKAKEQNFVARSVFKLEEIDKRWKLFKLGQRVLDLGAFPGSWSQYASKKVGNQGAIIGIDLKEVTVRLSNAEFWTKNIFEVEWGEQQFDIVMSDMAPATTGIKSIDQAKSLELCEMALQIARERLQPGGHFVCKLFHGSDFESFRAQMRKVFEKVEVMKPDSTRKSSKEIFLVGIRKNRI